MRVGRRKAKREGVGSSRGDGGRARSSFGGTLSTGRVVSVVRTSAAPLAMGVRVTWVTACPSVKCC